MEVMQLCHNLVDDLMVSIDDFCFLILTDSDSNLFQLVAKSTHNLHQVVPVAYSIHCAVGWQKLQIILRHHYFHYFADRSPTLDLLSIE